MAKVVVVVEGQEKNLTKTFSDADKQAGKFSASLATMSTIATGVNSVIGISSKVFEQVSRVVNEAWGAYAKLSEEVRDFALVSGQSAEEASVFLQVLDDFQLSAEDATAAARFLKEQGLSPNLETLIDLSEQFKAIQDPAERLEFIQENLGRGGAKWVNVLNQEEDALRATAAAIDENLILSDEQIAKYEQQRLALDAVADSWQGLKVSVGEFIGAQILESQVLQRASDILEEQGQLHMFAAKTSQEYRDAVAQARAEMDAETQALMDNEDAAVENEQAIEDLVAQQKALSDTLSQQIGLIDNIQRADEAYTEKSQTLAEQRGETETELATLRAQGYWEQSQQIQGALGKLEEIKQAELDLAAERERQSLQFVSQILQQELARDGWTQSEFEAFAAQQEAWGLWSSDVVDKAQAAWEEANKITEAINGIPTDRTVTITVNQVGHIDPASAAGQQYYASERDRTPHAAGGSFLIPQSYGNEGFMMGNGDTASGGERVTITPRGGGSDNSSLIAAIQSTRVNEDRMVKMLRDALLQVSGTAR